jgi:hypothetical protein
MNHFAEASSDNALLWDNVLEFAESIAILRFAAAIATNPFLVPLLLLPLHAWLDRNSVALAR